MKSNENNIVKNQNPSNQALEDAIKTSVFILKTASVLILIFILTSGMVIINQHEIGLLSRFGKIISTNGEHLKPGIHFAFPYPIDEIIRVPVTRIQTVTTNSFWYALTEEEKNTGQEPANLPKTLKTGVDGYILTGDMNIMHYKWALRYKIVYPEKYIARFKNPKPFLQIILQNCVIKIAASMNVDDVWRKKLELFRQKVENLVTKTSNKLVLGIKVERVDLVEKTPPRQVRKAFNSVIDEELKFSQSLNSAKKYANKVMNYAMGESSLIISKANTDKLSKINNSKADAQYFDKILVEYRKNPGSVGEKLYQDVLKRVLQNIDEKFILNKNNKRELRIKISRNKENNNDKK